MSGTMSAGNSSAVENEQRVTRPLSTVSELIRIRWVAVVGQVITIAVAAWLVNIRLPLPVLFSIVGFTAMSNVILTAWLLPRAHNESWIPGILMMDIFLFAGLLGFSGGLENPFASFFLVHLAIGAMILKGRLLWLHHALLAVSFLTLIRWFYPLHQPFTHAGKLNIHLHLQGTLISLFLCGCCIAWFLIQISKALRERDQALVQAELKATRQKQLMHLATLAGGVAHELNTPLGTIALVAGEIHASLRSTDDSPELREDIALIRSEVERCRHILEKLNTQSTQSVGAPPEIIHTSSIPQQVLENFPTSVHDRIEFSLPAEDHIICQPREPVVQSLTTLIKNALEASEEAGVPVKLAILIKKGMVFFQVWNHGPHIPTETRGRMGEMFFSTKKQHHGMGLGLFLVRSFAESAGGNFVIETTPDSGTTISLVLPQESTLVPEVNQN